MYDQTTTLTFNGEGSYICIYDLYEKLELTSFIDSTPETVTLTGKPGTISMKLSLSYMSKSLSIIKLLIRYELDSSI